jgi:hypothetical protein
MAPLYQNGWEKMDKYYRLTDESPAYTAAIVLHPGYKWQYIQDTWEPEWLPKAEVDAPTGLPLTTSELTFAEAGQAAMGVEIQASQYCSSH